MRYGNALQLMREELQYSAVVVCLSVCLSVCPSHAGIVSKQLDQSKDYAITPHDIAQGPEFSHAKISAKFA